MGLKTLLGEVMDVMDKAEADFEVVEMASDVLKIWKAYEMIDTAFHESTKLSALGIISAARTSGALDVYEKILEGRQ